VYEAPAAPGCRHAPRLRVLIQIFPDARGFPRDQVELVARDVPGGSDQAMEHRRELITENARRFAQGLPLRNVVDKAVGY